MKLLDLFCGAGGCSVGYHRAGFTEIVGVDNRPMPRYPFEFVQADALEYLAEHGREFDAIHASPPCQAHSIIGRNREAHADLIPDTRRLLLESEKPWVIENVGGARQIREKTVTDSSSRFDPTGPGNTHGGRSAAATQCLGFTQSPPGPVFNTQQGGCHVVFITTN